MKNTVLRYLNQSNSTYTVPLSEMCEEDEPADNPLVTEFISYDRMMELVERLPEGYKTILGERGGGLSQGQRQLIAIARAALAEPRILILDEATSSVDTRTERLIQAALEKLLAGRTSFVIAHRLSTVRSADRIIVLQKGHIIEEGSHKNLIAKGGHYAELYDTYFRHQSPQAIHTPAWMQEQSLAKS